MFNSTSAPRTGSSRRSLKIALAAIPTSIALAVTVLPLPQAQAQTPGSSLSSSGFTDSLRPEGTPSRTPMRTEFPEINGLPEGVSVAKVEYLSDRHIKIYINSAAMPGEPIPVQVLLARDWYANPDATFPSLWALDGMRARDDESGWTIETDIEQFYADKNINVVMPVGGESSFYSDWLEPDKGKHYMWETFLTQEMAAVLKEGFRTNDQRAVVGLSMGGTGAFNLAQHRPDLFRFAGSFSGYLDTTTTGMPEAITAAMTDAGGYNAAKMWGPFYSQAWIDHDPKLGIEAMKDMKVYVSAGSGRASNPADQQNYAGQGLEVLSRLSSQTFVNKAKQADVGVIVRFRDSGVHAWPYWQFEMKNAWPHIAEALGMSEEDLGIECITQGAIGEVTKSGRWGDCVTNEYPVAGGVAQDFRDGRAYWSEKTGAWVLNGRISARYSEIGGPSSWLGFPKTHERATPDKVGRYNHFENGSIYWTPDTGAVAVPADIMREWGEGGYERGRLGYPTAAPVPVGEGLMQQFQGGVIARTPDNRTVTVIGAIAQKLKDSGLGDAGIGTPIAAERLIPGGALQEFEGGVIYWSPKTGAKIIKNGPIRDHWSQQKWETGPLGWPTSDTEDIPAGGQRQQFEGGTLEAVNGTIVKK
ncbi:alpha/beta hydrolase-fold protein [Corynebacterium sp. 11A]|uniref:alpha/beta hydrolase-fold protein n=1 Tax=Corynebacterium sp. 11A TaxID=2080510 RepID=UPI00178C1BDC|nr:alpha/beta hydrolase-fold protein [Corynebacterium sp. 11A]